MTSHTALLVSLPDLSAFMQVLIDVAIKGTIILVVARMLLPALRHASAAIRHLIWSGTVCGLLALPILAVTLPEWRVPILPSLMSTTSASSAIRGDEVEDTDA